MKKSLVPNLRWKKSRKAIHSFMRTAAFRGFPSIQLQVKGSKDKKWKGEKKEHDQIDIQPL